MTMHNEQIAALIKEIRQWELQREIWAKRHKEHVACVEEVLALRAVLQRIASMPIDPRPDGTHNYSRAALIEIARDALTPIEEQHHD